MAHKINHITKGMLSCVLLVGVVACTSTNHLPTSISKSTQDAEHLHKPSTHPARIAPLADQMRVTLLGTGSPVPSATRFGMSTLVQAGGYNLVFDEGVEVYEP